VGGRQTNVRAWSSLVVLDGHPRDGAEVVVRWRDPDGWHAWNGKSRLGAAPWWAPDFWPGELFVIAITRL
jgi:hypothetical protein